MNVDLSKQYESIKGEVLKAIGAKSPMAVPAISKVTLNVGLGQEASQDDIKRVVSEIEMISGQKPIITYVKKSEAGFKIREGWPIGTKVTLRGKQMEAFLFKLISIVLPRVRDFRGLNPRSFDGRGNFAMGVTEQIIFPEIDYDQIDKLRGMDITISTTAANDDLGRTLLAAFNFPFRT